MIFSAEMIAENIQRVRERMAMALIRAGRPEESVQLVAVTKGHPFEAVHAAVTAGASDLGENYVEEALGKIQALPDTFPVRWHMIGHVQSRKAAPACRHFDYLHSLDSLKLAARLDRFAAEAGRTLPVLLECNVSGEESKYGWKAWEEKEWGRLLPEIALILGFPNLAVRGLMTMAPFTDDPEAARPFFQRLYRLKCFLARQLPEQNWEELSMGMTADFEVAIQEGATMVRIGTAIFGERE